MKEKRWIEWTIIGNNKPVRACLAFVGGGMSRGPSGTIGAGATRHRRTITYSYLLRLNFPPDAPSLRPDRGRKLKTHFRFPPWELFVTNSRTFPSDPSLALRVIQIAELKCVCVRVYGSRTWFMLLMVVVIWFVNMSDKTRGRGFRIGEITIAGNM